MKPLMQLPLLLRDRNDSIMMQRADCICSGVDVGPREFIHNAQIQCAGYFLPESSGLFMFSDHRLFIEPFKLYDPTYSLMISFV